MRKVSVTVNGIPYEEHVPPRLLLSDFIRHNLGLTGTHVGCEHGVCGSCTVIVDGSSARSCLMLAVQVDGSDLITVEGLATGGELHPLQEAFKRNHALQCGFCTPGILLASVDFLTKNPAPTREQIIDMLSGHICRCTGYESIVDSIHQAGGGAL